MQIWRTLENGVSKYPALEGRYPIVIYYYNKQVSGIDYTFDPSKKFLQRVIPENILIHGEPLDLHREYTIAVRDYIYEGYDGYDELPKCENIDKTNDIANMFNICLKFFEVVKNLNQNSLLEQNYHLLEPSVFGFDSSNHSVIKFLEETAIFENDQFNIVIKTTPRITANKYQLLFIYIYIQKL